MFCIYVQLFLCYTANIEVARYVPGGKESYEF